MKEYIRLEYNDCFTECGKDISYYLNGFSRDKLLKVCASFLVCKHETVYGFFNRYFSEYNKSFANTLYGHLCSTKGDDIDKYVVTNTESTLRLFEYVFDNCSTEEVFSSGLEMEIKLFEAYLLFNSKRSEEESEISSSTKTIRRDRAIAMLFTQMFQYFDITNYNFEKEYYTQITKAIYLYEFLESNEQELYKKYINFYCCKDWRHLLSQFTMLVAMYRARTNRRAYVSIEINPEDHWAISFFEKLTAKETIEDIDFRNLRSHPFFRISENEYCIVYGYFLLELIYKGVYFKLKDLNKELPEGVKKSDFRSFYCDQFSEKTLLYKVLHNIYGGKYYQMSGEEIKTTYSIEGEPDYYIREGKNIYLFESKDIFISSEVKTSNNYKKISDEIRKKLYYYDDENGNRKVKAILQLINNIKKLLCCAAEWDKEYDEKDIEIFPILVLHDNIYNCPGLNRLINIWFEEELKRVGQNLPVHNITIINIDFFIAYKSNLQVSGNDLSTLIKSYHNYISDSLQKAQHTHSEREATGLYKNAIMSFEYYWSPKFNPDFNKMTCEVAKKIFD